MISTKDQEELFKLIANYLKKDLECLAIGGTAMMFSGYKNATKDIDIVFKNNNDRRNFIEAIKQLGYTEKAVHQVHDKKIKELFSRPLIFSRGEERFDLFVLNVFGFAADFSKNKVLQRHEFIGKKELKIIVPSREALILFKAITGREKDYEDVETIVKVEKTIDWESIISDAVKQRKNVPWILIDLEEALQKLRKITLIKQKYFDIIYKEQSR